MRILIAEDEKELNRILKTQLFAEGYSVDACFNGAEAMEYLKITEYDAVILDIMMPMMDGFQVITAMRKQGNNTPVLFLTAKSGIKDKVEGLDAGADDYLVKPFEFQELVARLRSIIRRKDGKHSPLLQCGDLVMDTARHTVYRDGREVVLIAKEYALLEYMMRNQGIVLTRGQIEQNIWNYDSLISSNVVDVYIRMLRKKIDKEHEIKLIHTVRGYGYMLKET